MDNKVELPLSEAKLIAEKYCQKIKPFCSKVVIAGSIRREKAIVGDIEIVAKPLIVPKFDLLGHKIGEVIKTETMPPLGECHKNGMRYKQYWLEEGIGLDLFLVLPPAQWGIILMLRTGSAKFNKQWVTKKNMGGFRPSDITMADGVFWRGGKIIETPTEQAVFEALGLKYIEPQERQ